MTKFEMAKVIFNGNEYKAEKYARNTDKEQVTRVYNKRIERMNRRTVLPKDKFSALETALYKWNGGQVYCQAIYNTSPVEFQICWGGHWASIEETTKFIYYLKEATNLCDRLNELHIVVDEDTYSGEDYYKLINRYAQIVKHYYWLDIDGGKDL